MTFSSDLQKFAQKTGTRMDLVVKKVCLDLTRDLVKATPVDTGMARANYFISFDRSGAVETTPSRNGAPSLTRSAQFASNLKAGGVFYITNNLPYIMALEYGSSTQAPAGMARVTVARWQSIVNRIAGEVAK
jgi:hypothetical protein